MRCGRCGNENADTNRFCGMCGAPLSPAPAQSPVAELPRPTASPAPPPKLVPTPVPAPGAPTEPLRTSPPPVHDAPVITGPSFLGLNKPAPSSGRGASLHPAQDHLRSSRNLDYLLEDEEEQEPRHGMGKVLLMLLALSLALGFGYFRWKQGGFDWVTAGEKKPPAAQTSDSSQPAANPAAPSPSAPAGLENAGGTAANSSSAAPASAPANTPAPTAAPSTSASDSGGASTPPAAAAISPASTPDAGATPPKPSDAASAAATPQLDSSKTPDKDTAEKPPEAESPHARAATVAKPSPARAPDPVADAERYIYGRGVRQDCDRGMRELKPAAEQANPKAMISLGALYATGVCAPRDLPTAYRWFALALRKLPDNEPLQENLQKIWAQMTQPERQLAVKLTQ